MPTISASKPSAGGERPDKKANFMLSYFARNVNTCKTVREIACGIIRAERLEFRITPAGQLAINYHQRNRYHADALAAQTLVSCLLYG